MTLQKRACIGLALFPLLSLLFSLPAQSVEVNFTGTLIDNPPCTVNNSEAIAIDFGEIGITKIDGVNYPQPLTLTLDCASTLGGDTVLSLEYDGMAANSFDIQALQTSRKGLGIRLYQSAGSQLFPINSGYSITMAGGSSTSLDLYAVPVAASGADLLEGEFTATASFELQYP